MSFAWLLTVARTGNVAWISILPTPIYIFDPAILWFSAFRRSLKQPSVQRSCAVQPIDAATIDYQKQIADTFMELKLIPKKLVVTDAKWRTT